MKTTDTATRWLVAVALTAGLAAGGPASAQRSDGEREEQALAYAQCMRENGYEEFPDPSPDGRLRIQVTAQTAPRFDVAREACKDLAPAGLAGGSPDSDRIDQLVRFAQCMRGNGVADFPDPDSEGQFNFRNLGIDMDGATAEAAMNACTQEAGVLGPNGGGIAIRR